MANCADGEGETAMASRSFPVGTSSFNAVASATSWAPKNQGSECRHLPTNNMRRLWFHPRRGHLRILQVHGVESLSNQATCLSLLDKLADISERFQSAF